MAKRVEYGIEELRRDLRRQAPEPVYVVEGGEALLAAEALQAIVEATLPAAARDFNLDVFAGDDETGKEFLSRARSFPFLSERRVVAVRRFDKLRLAPRAEDELLEYLRAPVPTTVLVLAAAKLDHRTTLVKALEMRTRVVMVEALRESKLPAWVRQRVASRGVEVTEGACRRLVELSGPSLLELGNDIDKLLARYADVPRLEEQHVEATVDRHRVEEIWAITRAFRPDDAPGFLRTLARLLEAENEPLGLVAVLARHVGFLLRLRLLLERGVTGSGQIAARVGRAPWQIEQALPQARAFTREQLVLWQGNLQRAEVQMKSRRLAPRWILERAFLNSFFGLELA